MVQTPESTREGLYFVKEGKLRLYKLNENGKQFTLGILTRGNKRFFNLYSGLNEEIKELAKTSVRAAMTKEIEINQRIIDSIGVLHRNSARDKKEAVFNAMARNDAIRYFLNLDDSEQTEWKKPISQYGGSVKSSEMCADYQNLMHRISSTSYAPNIRRIAERRLYYDYTHTDYKNRRYLLDEELPERPKSSLRWEKFLDTTGNILGFSFGSVLIIYLGFFNDDSSSNTSSSASSSHRSTTTGNGNTFGSGGVSGGNSSSKSVSDSPQVKDGSGQAGFGNGGKSGHDAPSSAGVSKPNNATRNNNIANEKKYSGKTYDIFVADYSLPDYAQEEIFQINHGQTASVITQQTIKMQFMLPSDSGATYKLNGKEIKPSVVPSNIKDVTWIQFNTVDGENIIDVEYKNSTSYSTSRYTFQVYSNECFRNRCVLQ